MTIISTYNLLLYIFHISLYTSIQGYTSTDPHIYNKQHRGLLYNISNEDITDITSYLHQYKCLGNSVDTYAKWRTSRTMSFLEDTITSHHITHTDHHAAHADHHIKKFREYETINNTWIWNVAPEIMEYFASTPYYTYRNSGGHKGSIILTTEGAERSVVLLHAVKEIAESIGAQWMIFAGSHAGALLHGGPIPWDDDLDVAIDARYYDEFFAAAKEYRFSDGTRVHAQITAGGQKLFIDDPSQPLTRFGWGWPFADVFFYATYRDEGVIKEYRGRNACGKEWPLSLVFPLQEYFFGGIHVPGPNPALAKHRYDLNACVMGSYNHRNEQYQDFCAGDIDINMLDGVVPKVHCSNTHTKFLDCCALAKVFPTVHKIRTNSGNEYSVVAVNNTIKHIEPDSKPLSSVPPPTFHARCFHYMLQKIPAPSYKKDDPMYFPTQHWHIPYETRHEWATFEGEEKMAEFTSLIPNLDTVQVDNSFNPMHHTKNNRCGESGVLRVIEYNAERGKDWEKFAQMVTEEAALRDPDVILLNEMDIGMARSGNIHTTSMLAERMRMSFAWGIEYMELTNGDRNEQRRTMWSYNVLGLHGNAILSKCPIRKGFLQRGPLFKDYYAFASMGINANGYERRLGSRMILYAEVVLHDSSTMLLGSIHKLNETMYGAVKNITSSYSGIVIAGDQTGSFCPSVKLSAVDNPHHYTWPANCETAGRVRGDIICSDMEVHRNEVTLLACYKGEVLSDHAIKVVDLKLHENKSLRTGSGVKERDTTKSIWSSFWGRN